jgi:hypothetical protein
VDTRPLFRLVVLGTAPGEFVDQKLGELLRFKVHTHRVVLHAGPGVRRGVGFFAVRYSLPVEPIEPADYFDPCAVFRNAKLLQTCRGFVAFGPRAEWTPDVADLIGRAEAVFRYSIRVIEPDPIQSARSFETESHSGSAP